MTRSNRDSIFVRVGLVAGSAVGIVAFVAWWLLTPHSVQTLTDQKGRFEARVLLGDSEPSLLLLLETRFADGSPAQTSMLGFVSYEDRKNIQLTMSEPLPGIVTIYEPFDSTLLLAVVNTNTMEICPKPEDVSGFCGWEGVRRQLEDAYKQTYFLGNEIPRSRYRGVVR